MAAHRPASGVDNRAGSSVPPLTPESASNKETSDAGDNQRLHRIPSYDAFHVFLHVRHVMFAQVRSRGFNGVRNAFDESSRYFAARHVPSFIAQSRRGPLQRVSRGFSPFFETLADLLRGITGLILDTACDVGDFVHDLIRRIVASNIRLK